MAEAAASSPSLGIQVPLLQLHCSDVCAEASWRVCEQEARQAAAAAGLEALAQSPSPAGVPLGGACADSPSVQTRAKVCPQP